MHGNRSEVMLGILQIWMERLFTVFPFHFRNLAPKLTSSLYEIDAPNRWIPVTHTLSRWHKAARFS